MIMLPVHGNATFLTSAKEHLDKLYDQQRRQSPGLYELRLLEDAHPLYSVHDRIAGGAKAMPIWGVSDGSRLIAAVCENDIACAWQRQSLVRDKSSFSLGVNLLMYAAGGNEMLMRLRPVFQPMRGKVLHTVKIARLVHGGNWNTQPYALEYLSGKLKVENRVEIDVRPPAGADPDRLKGDDLIWVTGTSAFTLTDSDVQALGQHVDQGGMLFFNAVGGSQEFTVSARAAITRIIGERDIAQGTVSSDSALMTGKCGEFRGPPIEKLKRTAKFKQLTGDEASPLRIYQTANRIAIVLAPYGIHDTMDGHTAHGAVSYMPDSARDLAANIVLYALDKRG
jgi:hypothetical protein